MFHWFKLLRRACASACVCVCVWRGGGGWAEKVDI